MVKYEEWDRLPEPESPSPVDKIVDSVIPAPGRKKIVSLLSHTIGLLDGTVIPPSGKRAYIEFKYGEPDKDLVMNTRVKAVRGIPDAQPNTLYVVSSLVARHLCRPDVVSPASCHRDREYSQDAYNHGAKVMRVPGFMRHLRD